jgi:mitogen-activated protein kinase 15
MSEEIEPHLYRKYEILQRLGKGAYGIVWKAVERKTKQIVALKKVFDAFHNDTDAQRTFREVMILQELEHDQNPNCVRLLNVIKAENNKDLYLIFDYMESDLHAVIRANILLDVHKVYIIYQILKSLLFLHTAEIIHRDLKPSNILIDSECFVKLADFGLARSVLSYDDETAPVPVMTEYVATRWYRAPEIVLGSSQYSKAVDMWSVGCILGELIIGKSIFPGKSTVNQIELIIDLLGKPKQEDLDQIGGAIDSSTINSMSGKQKYTFSTFFKGASPEAISFLKKCLEFNPNKRMSVEEALKHPFVAQFRDPEREYRATAPIIMPISDQKKLSVREYREAIYADIIKKKREQRRIWQVAYLRQLGINVADDHPIDNNLVAAAAASQQQTQQSGHTGMKSMGGPSNQTSTPVTSNQGTSSSAQQKEKDDRRQVTESQNGNTKSWATSSGTNGYAAQPQSQPKSQAQARDPGLYGGAQKSSLAEVNQKYSVGYTAQTKPGTAGGTNTASSLMNQSKEMKDPYKGYTNSGSSGLGGGAGAYQYKPAKELFKK